MRNIDSASPSGTFVSPSEVARIAGISLAHKLTIDHFLATGRWVIIKEGRDANV